MQCIHSFVFFGRMFNFLNFCEISNELSTTVVVNVKCMSFIRWLVIVFLSETAREWKYKSSRQPCHLAVAAKTVEEQQHIALTVRMSVKRTTKKSKRDGIHCAKNECSKRPVDGWMANDISIVLFGEFILLLLRLSLFFFSCARTNVIIIRCSRLFVSSFFVWFSL